LSGQVPARGPCGSENLDLMPGHGVDHSSAFPGWRASAASPEKSVGSEPWATRQNFRKRTRQSFRNPQVATRCARAARISFVRSIVIAAAIGLLLWKGRDLLAAWLK
jgi:hypothetical protein